jgi:hypothetical protein
MHALLRIAQESIAHLPSTMWELRNDERWRLAAKWSAGLWAVNTVVFFFTLKQFDNAYLAIGLQTVLSEAQSYLVNKRRIFPDRAVSVPSSSSLSVPMAVFCFVYHKAAGILLVAIFGLGAIPAKAVLTGIGIMENPLRFLFNDRLPFADKTENDVTPLDSEGSRQDSFTYYSYSSGMSS